MDNPLYSYPKSAEFGRVVPKNKIYEHTSLSSAVKQLFVGQVEQIVWQYKLAPETVNLKASKAVPEIQVFSIALKGGELKTEVLRCIDQAIPFPILFELRYDEKTMSIAAYKRPSESDSGKWVISEYFDGGWISPQIAQIRADLPLVMDLGQLYERLLDGLMPYPARSGEKLAGPGGKNGDHPFQTA